jgi:hypothetical protein
MSIWEVVFDNTVPVCRVGELQPKDQRVFIGLLETVARILIGSLCFYYCDSEITTEAQKVIGTLLWATRDFASRHDDSPVSEGLLSADLLVIPPRCV